MSSGNVKANDRIRLSTGQVMTLGEALDAGLLYLYSVDNPPYKNKKYVARENDTDNYWVIGQKLFESRGGSSTPRVSHPKEQFLRKYGVCDFCREDLEDPRRRDKAIAGFVRYDRPAHICGGCGDLPSDTITVDLNTKQIVDSSFGESEMRENPTKLPPGVVEDQPPDEESIFGSRLGTRARVTWPWLKSKFGKQPPREEVSDRDYWNGSWGKLTIEVRPFDANGKWLEHLNQEFTPDSLRAARQYGFDLMRDLPEVDGFWCEARLDKYWTDRGTRESMRMMILGRYERAQHTPNAAMSFEQAKQRRDSITHDLDHWTAILNAFPKGAMGLTLDSARATPEYREARSNADRLFRELQNFNTWFVKAFKTELAEERRLRRSGGLKPNASHYVWVIGRNGAPIDGEGPYGPMALSRAESFARIGATEGSHDRAVSTGVDVMASGFKIIRRYRRGTGERVL